MSVIVLRRRPRLLDLCSGAGGAAVGYGRAGFDVTGVDLAPQPRYPFAFVQEEALAFVARCGHLYDAIHASFPCQGYSIMRNLPWLRERAYPLLIAPGRELLRATGKPYVIENVAGARYGARGLVRRGLEAHGLQAGYLCGTMFGKRFYRHRYFETNWFWLAPAHEQHRNRTGGAHGAPGTIKPGRFLGNRGRVPFVPGDARGVQAWPGRRGEGGHGLTTWQERAAEDGRPCGVGHTAGSKAVREEMECLWMNGTEVTQAVPPVYTEYLGRALLAQMGGG